MYLVIMERSCLFWFWGPSSLIIRYLDPEGESRQTTPVSCLNAAPLLWASLQGTSDLPLAWRLYNVPVGLDNDQQHVGGVFEIYDHNIAIWRNRTLIGVVLEPPISWVEGFKLVVRATKNKDVDVRPFGFRQLGWKAYPTGSQEGCNTAFSAPVHHTDEAGIACRDSKETIACKQSIQQYQLLL